MQQQSGLPLVTDPLMMPVSTLVIFPADGSKAAALVLQASAVETVMLHRNALPLMHWKTH